MLEARDGRQQATGVGHARCRKHLGDAALFDDTPGVHHHYPVGDFGHHAKVVGNEQNRHAVLFLQGAQQVEDLRLHGNVQRGSGLVGDQYIGFHGQGDGDHHPLAHATGQLVGEAVQTLGRFRDAHLLQQRQGPLARFGLAQVLMEPNGLGDLVAHAVHRVERRQGFLKDHRHAVAAHMAHLLFAHRHKIDRLALAVGDNGAAFDAGLGRGGKQFHHRQAGDALA